MSFVQQCWEKLLFAPDPEILFKKLGRKMSQTDLYKEVHV